MKSSPSLSGVLFALFCWAAINASGQSLFRQGGVLLPTWETEATRFRVQYPDGSVQTVSLYGVECPVIVIGESESNALKLWRQKLRFGIDTVEETWQVGLDARRLVLQSLEGQFSVLTPPKLQSKSAISFGPTDKDLAEVLIEAGVAWVVKEEVPHPNGLASSEVYERLTRIESVARQARKGIWAGLPTEVKQARTSRQILESHIRDIDWAFAQPSSILDPNQASRLELQMLNGVGPGLAKAIIQYREAQSEPVFRNAADLQLVHGIGEATVKDMAENLHFPKSTFSVFFGPGEYHLDSDQTNQIDRLLPVLNRPPLCRLSITGFASREGDEDFNLALSKQRAIAVKEYLERKGFKTQRFASVDGRGESDPGLSNEKGRRVELTIQ